jgi:CBS domain-containing protein
MLARELAEEYPLVHGDDGALEAAELIAARRLPGVVVVDDAGRPVTVLPGPEVLRFLVPEYVQEDPSLARVFDEGTADRCAARLRERRVGELLPPKDERRELPVVDGDATVVECAAVMARLRSPLLVVTDDGHVVGVVTASHLLALLLPGVG